MKIAIALVTSFFVCATQAQASSFSFSCVGQEISIRGDLDATGVVTKLTFVYLPTKHSQDITNAQVVPNPQGRGIAFYPKGFGPMTLKINDNRDNSYSRAVAELVVTGPDIPDRIHSELECAGESL